MIFATIIDWIKSYFAPVVLKQENPIQKYLDYETKKTKIDLEEVSKGIIQSPYLHMGSLQQVEQTKIPIEEYLNKVEK